jgi:Family of unknown function (DUF6263)
VGGSLAKEEIRMWRRGMWSVVTGLLLMISASLHAQTTLRWQLKPGEKLAMEVTQKTTSEVAYASKKTTTEIEQKMTLGWEVASVEGDKIRLKQKLERFEFKMGPPGTVSLEYDSSKADRLTGQAKEVAAAIAPLLKTTIEITMNERGEVLEAKATGEGAEQLTAPSADASQPPLVSKESIQQLLRQPLAVLPEKTASSGDPWTTTTELTTALGKVRQTTEYRYAGTEEKEGIKLERINVKTELKLDAVGSSAKKLSLKQHEQSGIVLFDSAASRLNSAEQTQKLVTERPYRETTIVVTLTTEQKTEVKSAAKK